MCTRLPASAHAAVGAQTREAPAYLEFVHLGLCRGRPPPRRRRRQLGGLGAVQQRVALTLPARLTARFAAAGAPTGGCIHVSLLLRCRRRQLSHPQRELDFGGLCRLGACLQVGQAGAAGRNEAARGGVAGTGKDATEGLQAEDGKAQLPSAAASSMAPARTEQRSAPAPSRSAAPALRPPLPPAALEGGSALPLRRRQPLPQPPRAQHVPPRAPPLLQPAAQSAAPLRPAPLQPPPPPPPCPRWHRPAGRWPPQPPAGRPRRRPRRRRNGPQPLPRRPGPLQLPAGWRPAAQQTPAPSA